MNPEDPYEFEVPVKKSKLCLYPLVAIIATILAYVILEDKPASFVG